MGFSFTHQASDLVQDWTGDFVVEEEPQGLRQGETQTAQPATENATIQTTQATTALDFTDDFAVEQDEAKVKRDAEAFRETDPHRLSQRQRQIDFGKNTVGYQRLSEAYPNKRNRPRDVPKTPDVHKKCSKRAFDGLVRVWRRRLHEWDMPEAGGGVAVPRDPRIPQKKRSGAKREREGEREGERGDGVGGGSSRKQPRERERKEPSSGKGHRAPRRTSVKSDCGIELDFEE